MADFTISRPVPFEVQGVDGATYELPRLMDMDAEHIARLADMAEAKGLAAQAAAAKEFVLGLCPEMADEPLSDTGWLRLLNALTEGSDFGLGES